MISKFSVGQELYFVHDIGYSISKVMIIAVKELEYKTLYDIEFIEFPDSYLYSIPEKILFISEDSAKELAHELRYALYQNSGCSLDFS